MAPYGYVERVTKKKLTDADHCSTNWPESWVPFHADHPQARTHVQVIRDVSNPRLVHPVPVLLGYTLPQQAEDPEKFALVIMSLLTPHGEDGKLKANKEDSWDYTLKSHMEALAVVDPHRHKRTADIIRNMTCITSGRDLQRIERVERERLRQEQGLVSSVPDGPNDFDPNQNNDIEVEGEEIFSQTISDSLLNVLPKKGPWTLDQPEDLANMLGVYRDAHHSRKGNAPKDSVSQAQFNSEFRQTFKSKGLEFDKILRNKRQQMYDEDSHKFRGGATTTSNKTFKCLVGEYGLDSDQELAFVTIAQHILKVDMHERGLLKDKPQQMIFYLGGEGGTGKSKVLNALTGFLESVGLRHTIRMGAKTGCAAGNIGGSTLHSLLKLPVGRGKKTESDQAQKDAPVTEELKDKFKDVKILFIDEISMISCQELAIVSQKLTHIKNTRSNAAVFGGMTTILAGDFYQLKPHGSPLYKVPGATTKDENFTLSLQGFRIMQQITHAVFLKTQYRMAGDKEYMDFVTRFRHGQQQPETDRAYLNLRKVTNTANLETGIFKDCETDPVIIVNSNANRYHINMTKAAVLAKATHQKLYFSVAQDKCKGHVLTTQIRRELLLKPDGAGTGYGAGLLPLVVGMPIMIKANIGTELNVTNGSMGKITKIVLDSRERVVSGNDDPHYCAYQPIVYVKLPQSEKHFRLPNLPVGVIPMTALHSTKQSRSMYFTHNLKLPGKTIGINIIRKQLWFLPAFAITVDNSQGRTLESAIIDLSAHHTAPNRPYVMLSRLTTVKWLGVQKDFNFSLWNVKPDKTMLRFLKLTVQPKAVTTESSKPSMNDMNDLLVKFRTRGKKFKETPTEASARDKRSAPGPATTQACTTRKRKSSSVAVKPRPTPTPATTRTLRKRRLSSSAAKPMPRKRR